MSEAATSTELVSTQHLSDEYNHYVKNEVGTQETVDYWPKHINKPKQIETTKYVYVILLCCLSLI